MEKIENRKENIEKRLFEVEFKLEKGCFKNQFNVEICGASRLRSM